MTDALVRLARKARGLTLREAAPLIGVAANTIAEAEHRGDAISVATLRRYAAGYGYRLDIRLVGETGDVIEEGSRGGGPDPAERMARAADAGD